jgi:CPA2 family monovalent cation:H+ antiporter-2
MENWTILFDVLLLLSAALVLGAICERLRQSAILGYLLAGILLGPGVLQLVESKAQVESLAELGVALLLFTIGLEFSWPRLKKLGAVAMIGGTAQVVATMLATYGLCRWLGLSQAPALAIGAMIALSSTACVVRLLIDRAELDSTHGRHAVGILLVQDISLVPLFLMVNLLGSGGDVGTLWSDPKVLLLVPLFVVFWLFVKFAVPWFLGQTVLVRNRELPVLLAIVVALGSAWLMHKVNLSPAMGAFVAGIILGSCPFATQIRVDITSLRTLLVTLFFSTIGALANPVWMFDHLSWVVCVVVAVLVGKTIIIWLILRLFRQTHGMALATGFCLAQVGEFSFVLAETSHQLQVISEDIFHLMVSVTIVTFLLTPQLVKKAVPYGSALQKLLTSKKKRIPDPMSGFAQDEENKPYVVIIGFGPAGQMVAGLLMEQKNSVAIVDLNPQTIKRAKELGFYAVIGDAAHREVLEHIHIAKADMIVITIPDPKGARRAIMQVRALAPLARVISRARYHVYRWELEIAGADVVVDEEEQVGKQLACEVDKFLKYKSDES